MHPSLSSFSPRLASSLPSKLSSFSKEQMRRNSKRKSSIHIHPVSLILALFEGVGLCNHNRVPPPLGPATAVRVRQAVNDLAARPVNVIIIGQAGGGEVRATLISGKASRIAFSFSARGSKRIMHSFPARWRIPNGGCRGTVSKFEMFLEENKLKLCKK